MMATYQVRCRFYKVSLQLCDGSTIILTFVVVVVVVVVVVNVIGSYELHPLNTL